MKNGDTIELAEPAIIERGRGPEIKGTRITVYDILDYILEGWHTTRIAAHFNISSRQVDVAHQYLLENKFDVLRNYLKILERCQRGNSPELQARLDVSRERAQAIMRQFRQAQGESPNGGNHGGQ